MVPAPILQRWHLQAILCMLQLILPLAALQTTHGCGDLIFSSHTTFALVGILTYTEYGGLLITKVSLCWAPQASGPFLYVGSNFLCAGFALLFLEPIAYNASDNQVPGFMLDQLAHIWSCLLQAIAWLMVATLSVLIVASRKHYTVDVVIAW